VSRIDFSAGRRHNSNRRNGVTSCGVSHTMKRTRRINDKTRTLLFIIAFVLMAGILFVSCGGGGYGGGGNMAMVLPPVMFSLMTPTNGERAVSTMPNLTWGASLYATGYHVYIKKDGDAMYPAPVTVTATSLTISTALAPSTLYDWKVTAFNSSGMVTATTFTFTTGS
jgi:hypothetical protein